MERHIRTYTGQNNGVQYSTVQHVQCAYPFRRLVCDKAEGDEVLCVAAQR